MASSISRTSKPAQWWHATDAPVSTTTAHTLALSPTPISVTSLVPFVSDPSARMGTATTSTSHLAILDRVRPTTRGSDSKDLGRMDQRVAQMGLRVLRTTTRHARNRIVISVAASSIKGRSRAIFVACNARASGGIMVARARTGMQAAGNMARRADAFGTFCCRSRHGPSSEASCEHSGCRALLSVLKRAGNLD